MAGSSLHHRTGVPDDLVEPVEPVEPVLRRGPRILALVVVAGVLLGLVAVSFAVGARAIPLPDVGRALLAWTGITGGTGLSGVDATVVQDMRMTRTLAGLLAGSALGVAGALLQALTRNPLADPGLLGVNAGAAFAVTVGLSLAGGLPMTALVWLALLGAGAATVAVHALAAGTRDGASPARLVLCGVAVAAVLGGATSALQLFDGEVLRDFTHWSAGSLAGRNAGDLLDALPFVLAGLVLALGLARPLNALGLGEDTAIALGTHVRRTRALTVLAVTLLAGAATAVVGPIGFLGLLVPHLLRPFTGPDQRWVIPLSAVLAPAVLLGADVVGRVVLARGELPASLVVAVVGAPALVVLARRRRVGAL